MKISFILLIFLWATTILLTSCSGIQNNSPPIIPTQSGKITSDLEVKKEVIPIFSLSEKDFDFGKIKQSGGKVEHTFVLQYDGQEPLKITGVPTSCACTSAKIDKTILSTGESAIITVTFDPNLHEEPEGKFFKTISILTEPSIQNSPELKIWAEIDLDLGKDSYKLKASHKD